MLKTKFIIFTAVVFLSVYSCYPKTDPVTGKIENIEPSADKRAREFVDKGGGIFSNLNNPKNNNTFDFATSNVLWRATLKTLDFLPIINADYSGGIIIYDWYSTNDNSDEQIKISVRFLNNELRNESVQVLAYKKICKINERCSTVKIDNKFSNDIKEQIITYARILKIEESKKEKK
jgi:hypothetical protein